MLVLRKYNATFAPAKTRKGARVVEEARLESVLAAKPPQGFESPSFRNNDLMGINQIPIFCVSLSMLHCCINMRMRNLENLYPSK